MRLAHHKPTVRENFLQPLEGLAESSHYERACPGVSDAEWLRRGVERCLETGGSGRAFLQQLLTDSLGTGPSRSAYFASMSSDRRLSLLAGVERRVREAAGPRQNRLAHIPELAGYKCFAIDGHWHKAAAHDPRHNGVKMAVGHFYSLNMRTQLLTHLETAEGLHEADMSALKRIGPQRLRQDAPKGGRTLVVYDKAGIDFKFWGRCKREAAVYFLSRIKEGTVYDVLDNRPVDRSDPRNRGVSADQSILLREGREMRLISYTRPEDGVEYQFLTNEPDLPPCVLVELYRLRWEIEKVFDEIKNKLGEGKAWGSSMEARTIQALFITLTHNLMVLYEDRLEREKGAVNTAENKRRAQRAARLEETCGDDGVEVSPLLVFARNTTQRSVKFVRWLVSCLRQGHAEDAALPVLRHFYATL